MRPAAWFAAFVLGLNLMIEPPAKADATLLDSAATGRADLVSAEIAAGADVEIRDGQGRTPLLLAVAGNHVAVAKALLAAGASPNAQAANRDTPWLLAGASGRTEIVAAMLPLKPDLSIRNRYGGNALIPACERAHVETVKLLLTSGIDLDHVNDLGWTCLLEIVILGDGGPRHREVARLVLAAGADPTSPTRTASLRSAMPASAARARSAGSSRRPADAEPAGDLALAVRRVTSAAKRGSSPPDLVRQGRTR